MMKRMTVGYLAAGLMGLAMVPAGAREAFAQKTTVKESSSSNSLTTTYSGGTSSAVKDDLFAGTEIFAKGASDVTEITMDPDSLGMVGGKDSKKAHNMLLSVVRTYEYDKPGMYRMEDVEVFRNKLNSGDWHCSVHTRSLKTGESTDVCQKRRTDDLTESAILTVEPKSLTFIHTIMRKGAGESEVNVPLGLAVPSGDVTAMLAGVPAMVANRAETLRVLDSSAETPRSFLMTVPDGATVSTEDGVVKALPDGKLEVRVPSTPEAKALLDGAKEQGRAVSLEELQGLGTPVRVR